MRHDAQAERISRSPAGQSPVNPGGVLPYQSGISGYVGRHLLVSSGGTLPRPTEVPAMSAVSRSSAPAACCPGRQRFPL